MSVASLVLVMVLGQSSPTSVDPTELVDRLGAPRYAERQAATEALERLGRHALPALRAARGERDPEVRSRVAALVTRIEGALLTQPSTVQLNFDDAPLHQVLKSFSDQSGIRLTLQPENGPQFRARKVTLHESEPLPFWKALDRLCDAARLQYNSIPHGVSGGRDPSFLLFDGQNRPSAPTFDTGPFRVSVIGLHYQRDITFQPPLAGRPALPAAPGQAKGQEAAANPGGFTTQKIEQCYAQLQVVGEPRLTLAMSGALKITEAIDDKGQSLLPPIANNGVINRSAGYFGFANSFIQGQALLARPTVPGTTIRVLRGVIPVSVSTRKPSPLNVPLRDSKGKTFQNDDASVVIHDVRLLPNTRQTSIDVTIRQLGDAAPVPANEVMYNRPDTHQQQVEVVDAQGRVVPWYPSMIDGESGRMTITLTSPEQVANATELRYYSLSRAATDVKFEFNDLPLP
jgi:hypothetical protein